MTKKEYCKIIIKYFQRDFNQSISQEFLNNQSEKELLVGQALVISTEDETIPYLISAPTMRVPMNISNTVNTYLATKAALIAAKRHPGINSVIIPGMGTGIGGVPFDRAAFQMGQALYEVLFPNSASYKSLSEAFNYHFSLVSR